MVLEQLIELRARRRAGKAVEAALSASDCAARMKPPQAARASAPPTLMRRTPSAATSCSVNADVEPISRLTGLGATAATTASICSRVWMPGAYRQSAPAAA